MISINQIENVAKKIGERVNAKSVFLFGSYSRNQAGENSDVDLLVIADSNLPRHKRSRQIHLMFKPYPFPMDILVYTPEEVKKESEFEVSFISRALREGRKLYG
jgi:predicted nucleotidyltransferase